MCVRVFFIIPSASLTNSGCVIPKKKKYARAFLSLSLLFSPKPFRLLLLFVFLFIFSFSVHIVCMRFILVILSVQKHVNIVRHLLIYLKKNFILSLGVWVSVSMVFICLYVFVWCGYENENVERNEAILSRHLNMYLVYMLGEYATIDE